MLLEEVAATSTDVAATSSRLKKVERTLVGPRRDCGPTRSRSRWPTSPASLPHGSIGVGWASLREVPPPATRGDPRADRGRRDAPPDRRARRRRIEGGSREKRSTTCSPARPSRSSDFLRALLTGEIRQGALEGVMVDAVARAANVPLAEVRRAAMLAGDLGAGRRGRDRGRQHRARAIPPLAPDPVAADARAVGRGRRGGLRTDPARRRRVEARRRADPDPPARRRGPHVHAEPRRRHRSGAGDRGGDPAAPARGGRLRRRGDRAATRRPSASVRPDDEPVREPQPTRPRGAPRGLPTLRLRLRRPAPRRRGPDRPTGHRAVRRPRGTAPRGAARDEDRDRRRRRGRALPR